MGKYATAAAMAVATLARDRSITPREAWSQAVSELFPSSPDARDKGSPRDTFLCLCGMGVVESVPGGVYARPLKNDDYVVRALAALRAEPALADDPKRLWLIATDGVTKVENRQMEVLLALWRSGLIRREG